MEERNVHHLGFGSQMFIGPTNPEARHWARAADWEQHRAIIVRMYMGEMMHLHEVKNIMETEYGFYATEKMYKDRLRKWGIRKNKAPRRLCSSSATTTASAAATSQPANRAVTRAPGHDPTTPPPDPRSDALLDFLHGDLDGLKAFQAAALAMDEYTARVFFSSSSSSPSSSSPSFSLSGLVGGGGGGGDGTSTRGLMTPEAIYSHETVDWLAQLATGARLVRRGRQEEEEEEEMGREPRRRRQGSQPLSESTAPAGSSSSSSSSSRRGFGLISDCLDILCARADFGGSGGGSRGGASVSLPTLWDICYGAHVMSTVSPELFESFLRFVARLAEIRLPGGRRNPLARLADALLRLGWRDFATYGLGLGAMQLAAMHRHSRAANGPGGSEQGERGPVRRDERFTLEHRRAALRSQGWLLMFCYADLGDLLDESGDEVGAEEDTGLRLEQGAGGENVHCRNREDWDDKSRSEDRQKLRLERARISTATKDEDPIWAVRESMWRDCVIEATGLMVEMPPVYQIVRRRGRIKFLTYIN